MRLSKTWEERRRLAVAVAIVPLTLGLLVALPSRSMGTVAEAQPSCVTPTPPPTPPPAVLQPVCYAAGWNMVGGDADFPAPLWLWNPASEQYQPVPTGLPSAPARVHGAWAYLAQNTAVTFAVPTPSNRATQQTLAPGWNLVSDPFKPQDAAFCDNTNGYAYDPTTGTYAQATTIPLGSSVWIYAPVAASLALLPMGGSTASVCPSPVKVTTGPGILVQVSRGLELQSLPVFTALFMSPGPWRLQYTYDCTAYAAGGAGSFLTSVLNPDGSTVDTPASLTDAQAAGGGAKDYQASGSFYIEISSVCAWTVSALPGP